MCNISQTNWMKLNGWSICSHARKFLYFVPIFEARYLSSKLTDETGIIFPYLWISFFPIGCWQAIFLNEILTNNEFKEFGRLYWNLGQLAAVEVRKKTLEISFSWNQCKSASCQFFYTQSNKGKTIICLHAFS